LALYLPLKTVFGIKFGISPAFTYWGSFIVSFPETLQVRAGCFSLHIHVVLLDAIQFVVDESLLDRHPTAELSKLGQYRVTYPRRINLNIEII